MLTAIRITTCLCAALLCELLAFAQDYPTRPIRLIVPFAAGGAGDLIARPTARKISEALGQPIIVENRPGAGGTVGSAAVANAAADGYTLGLGTVSTLALAPAVHANPPYQPLLAFAPIGLVARAPFLVAVNPTLPATSLQELVDLAKAKPGQLNFASIGDGTLQHFTAEQFKALTGVNIVHVPYKGGGPALIDLLAGHVQVMFDILPVFQLKNITGGRIRVLAIAAKARLPQLPSVPTAAEAGCAGLEANAWFGLVAPRATPEAIVGRLSTALREALSTEDLRDAFSAQGFLASHSSPLEFEQLISTEIARWAQVVKDSGFKTH